MDTTVAILAGGLATRLLPLTESIPKSLVSVAGRPFIDHQLAVLRDVGGARSVVLCVGHQSTKIREHVGDGGRYGLRVTYSEDGPTSLGTGGAITNALPGLSDPFFVTYGDSYLSIELPPLLEAFQTSGCSGGMTVFKNENRWDRSNVDARNGRVVTYDKVTNPSNLAYVDWGMSVFRKSAFEGRKRDVAFDLGEVYRTLSADLDLFAYEVFERFFEMGSHAGRAELEARLESARRA